MYCAFFSMFWLKSTSISKNEVFNDSFNVNLSLNNVTLKNVIDLLSKQTDVVFSYDRSLETRVVNEVSVNAKNESLNVILDKILKGSGIKYEIKDHVVLLYDSKTSKSTVYISDQSIPVFSD